MLATIDVQLPDYALRISDLVPLDRRLDFVERFVPDFEQPCVWPVRRDRKGSESASDWIDRRLATYGKDARALVGEAMAAYLQFERRRTEATTDAAVLRRRQCLDIMETVFFGPKSGNPDAS